MAVWQVPVMEDTEILAFWEEVKTKGHPDLAADAWPELKDIASLRDILTSIAFNGSVHHSAVNFGMSAVLCAEMLEKQALVA